MSKTPPGHVTAGAILVGSDGRILHILHNATQMWLLPGGHLEPSDETLLQAANSDAAWRTVGALHDERLRQRVAQALS